MKFSICTLLCAIDAPVTADKLAKKPIFNNGFLIGTEFRMYQ